MQKNIKLYLPDAFKFKVIKNIVLEVEKYLMRFSKGQTSKGEFLNCTLVSYFKKCGCY